MLLHTVEFVVLLALQVQEPELGDQSGHPSFTEDPGMI